MVVATSLYVQRMDVCLLYGITGFREMDSMRMRLEDFDKRFLSFMDE
jgi:hypothetical protein